jgi:hypothetical protein
LLKAGSIPWKWKELNKTAARGLTDLNVIVQLMNQYQKRVEHKLHNSGVELTKPYSFTGILLIRRQW